VRADTFGYLQRSFPGLYSEVDAEEAREVGRTAARAALKGSRPHGSVAIVRKKKNAYAVNYEIIELAEVAKATRPLDEHFIQGDNDVAPAFLDYVQPLVGKLPRMARLSDHPVTSE
jgi:6-phosphofructokinase 1